MSSSQAVRSIEDPVRIVYHTANRTFARLFNEDSLEEVKDVVRVKLDLGPETDVSLKQVGPNGLVDLEDDEDFRAFRVFIKSCVSVDIEVTIDASRTSERSAASIRAPSWAKKSARVTRVQAKRHSKSLSLGVPVPREQLAPSRRLDSVSPEESEEESFGEGAPRPADTHATPSISDYLIRKQPTSNDRDNGATLDKSTEERFDQLYTHPEVCRRTETPSTPMGQKRPLSSNHDAVEVSNKPAGQCASAQPTTATAKTKGSLTTSGRVDTGEPPKKKRKKEPTKKGVEIANAPASPATEPLAAKTKPRKTTTSTRVRKTGTSTPKDAGTSEPPTKRKKKPKKDVSTELRESSAAADQDDNVDMDQPISEVGNPANERPLQLDTERPTEPTVEGGTLKTHQHKKMKAPTIGVCAAVPQTIASVCVESEVIAAIISYSLSKTTETIPAEPPLQRKPIKRAAKSSTAPSKILPREPTVVVDAPANEIPNVPVECGPEQKVSAHKPPRQSPDVKGPPCPICLGEPFHIRYYCPIVLKGPDAVRERLEELKKTRMGKQLVLISQLECLLRDSEVTFVSSLNAVPTGAPQSSEASPPPVTSLPRTPNTPGDSYSPEATTEIRSDRGSSPESVDEMSEGCIEPRGSSIPQRQKPDEHPLPSNSDLESIVRGPMSEQRSILDLLDRIVGVEDGDSDTEEDEVQLEEDSDEDIDRLRRRSSKRTIHSSDFESEEEESRSPSPSHSPAGTSNNHILAIRKPEISIEESTGNQGGDIVIRDSVDSSAPGRQHDDGSEETYVESEDRIVVDEPLWKKGTPIVAEERAPSHVPGVSVLQPAAPSHEPEESAKMRDSATPNANGSTPAASEVLKQVQADPIEPADDLVPPSSSRSPNADPIEASSDEVESLFANVTQSSPKPGVSKRMKARNGEMLDDAERPVLVELLALEATHANEDIPLLAREKSLPNVTKAPASQELSSTRKGFRFNSPFTSTPAAMALPNRRSKAGTRTGKAAKRSQERSDVSKSRAGNDPAQDGPPTTPTPAMWETLAVPSSPSVRLDEPSVLVDELMSSSPQPNDTLVIPGNPLALSQMETPQEKGRLFDLSASQIPFPYSQKKNLANPEPALLPNGGESDGMTDPEEVPLALQMARAKAKAKTKLPVRYRSLSQLASQTHLFSPSFPTPTNKSATVGKTKKGAATDQVPSSSSSSDEEADGSEHIPQGRRAGSTSKTKKSGLSRA